ncbi:MAG: putative sugar O-methyltransferase [Candidatus Omnitrophota bacterium]
MRRLLNSYLFRAAGISLINYDLLKYLRHYLWIFHLNEVPTLKISFREPLPVAAPDIVLAKRLIAAYRKATADCSLNEKNTSRLWSQEIKRNCGLLIAAIDKADEQELAFLLASMFRSDFVYGLASGSLVSHARGSAGKKIWSMKYQDNVVSLAEYLGVVRLESTQQGTKAYALKNGLGEVVGKIEKALGVKIGFPDIGAPYGVMVNDSLITMEHPEHLYVGLRLGEAVREHLALGDKPLHIVEIGAGFGGLAYWVMNLKQIAVADYTVIDLPLINVLQGYFLAKAFGVLNVRLYGEPHGKNTLVSVLPHVAYEKEISYEIDLLINENSMPEMTEEIVGNYIRYARKKLSGIFFSYNHEAYNVVYEKPQVYVPGIMSYVGGFKRLSRNASWVRSGYAEEVYKRQNGGERL